MTAVTLITLPCDNDDSNGLLFLLSFSSSSLQLRNASHSNIAIDAEREAWNRLIDANVRSGIMACVWCMKAQVVKMTAMAFHKWKTVNLLDISHKLRLSGNIGITGNIGNITFNPSGGVSGGGNDATMEAAAAAAQYFQHLMSQIPIGDENHNNINNYANNNNNNNNNSGGGGGGGNVNDRSNGGGNTGNQHQGRR